MAATTTRNVWPIIDRRPTAAARHEYGPGDFTNTAPARHETRLEPWQVEALKRARRASRRSIGKGITARPALVAMMAKAERGMGDGRAREDAYARAGEAARAFLLRRKALAPGIASVLAPITRAVREAGRR